MTLIKSFVDALDEASKGKVIRSLHGKKKATIKKGLLIDVTHKEFFPLIIDMQDLYDNWIIEDENKEVKVNEN